MPKPPFSWGAFKTLAATIERTDWIFAGQPEREVWELRLIRDVSWLAVRTQPLDQILIHGSSANRGWHLFPAIPKFVEVHEFSAAGPPYRALPYGELVDNSWVLECEHFETINKEVALGYDCERLRVDCPEWLTPFGYGHVDRLEVLYVEASGIILGLHAWMKGNPCFSVTVLELVLDYEVSPRRGGH